MSVQYIYFLKNKGKLIQKQRERYEANKKKEIAEKYEKLKSYQEEKEKCYVETIQND